MAYTPSKQTAHKFLAVGGLTLTLAVPIGALAPQAALAAETTQTSASPQETQEIHIVEGVHTDAIAAAVGETDHQLHLNVHAGEEGSEEELEASQTVFYLPDNKDSKVTVPKGYEFIAPQGSTAWMAPQNRIEGLLWPGWSTEDLPNGVLKNDTLKLELVKAETPANGSVEIFKDGLTGIERVWSSDENYKTHDLTANAHVHANWAFTQKGVYKLTFRATANLADGTPVSDEQTYTFAIGVDPAHALDPVAAPAPTTPAPTTPAPSPSSQPSQSAPAPSQSAPAPSVQPTQSAPAPSQSAQPTQSPAVETSLLPAPAPTQEAVTPSQPASEQKTAPAQTEQKQTEHIQSKQQVFEQTQPARCTPTEVQIKKAPATGINQQPNNLPAAATSSTANQSVDRATDGHFDLGPILKGNDLTVAVKDDRVSPGKWVEPQSLDFVLSDAAKTKLPAGMDYIGQAGSDIWMIGATQQKDVPWLGWNTQNSELVENSDGSVSMKLDSVSGPGKMAVFLSGNFGAAGEQVFDSSTLGSFEVRKNTHQHSNWVFTAPGHYTAHISWTVKLKDGSTKTASNVLNFEVGNVANQSTPVQEQTSQPVKSGVDTASGIVTKADGSQVEIVGKTANGADCDLPANQLADAQLAAAQQDSAQQTSAQRQQLAYTGAHKALLLAGSGLGLFVVGSLALYLVRRRSNA